MKGGYDMSEKRREELKEEINKRLDKLSVEDLERIAGGFDPDSFGGNEYRFKFTKEEAEALFHATGKGTCPYCGKVFS